MNISKIYEKYKIMPQLQLHMLRVAGVASIICDNFRKEIDKESVVSACLLHDMGVMSKIKLDLFPEHSKGKGIEYWEKIISEFINKYGVKEEKALYKIIKELKVKNNTSNLIKGFGFSNTSQTFKSKDFQRKICVYSDMRVSPQGVVSLVKRLDEAKERYLNKQRGIYTKKQFDKNIPLWQKIEEQIFYQTDIKPESITDRKIMPLILKLKNFDIKTK